MDDFVISRGGSQDYVIKRGTELSLPKWEIWQEGFRLSAFEGGGEATMIATGVRGETFQDACDRYCSKLDSRNFGTYDSEKRTLWGCKLYPSENLARRSFG